jgi:hypothetical protein
MGRLTHAYPIQHFDPAAWLGAFVEIGGGYALAAGGKLWLVVQDCPAGELATVMSQVVGRSDRIAAIRFIIERRQNGEVL